MLIGAILAASKLELMLQVYTEPSSMVSSGTWDVGGNEVSVGTGAEDGAGEAAEVRRERRDTVVEGTTD